MNDNVGPYILIDFFQDEDIEKSITKKQEGPEENAEQSEETKQTNEKDELWYRCHKPFLFLFWASISPKVCLAVQSKNGLRDSRIK